MPIELIEPIKLTEEQVKDLADLGPNIAVLEREVKKAERAGIDVGDLEKRLTEMKALREGLLREYT